MDMNKNLSLWRLTAALILGLASTLATAKGKPELVGWIEQLAFEDQDGNPVVVKGKLDTGAKTSSIYATSIERFKRKGKRWVRFDLMLKTLDGKIVRVPMERKLVRSVRIKEHKHKNNRRAVVMLDFCLGNQTHSAQFTLADRSKFNYPVLMGRRFLAGKFAIDPSRTYVTPLACEPVATDE
ncbi:MAG: ATP-dependent zinc protease [Panacagrimonas sp.]